MDLNLIRRLVTCDRSKVTAPTDPATDAGTAQALDLAKTLFSSGVNIPGLGSGDKISAAILIDFTKSAQNNWDAEISVLVKLANSLKETRIAVIAISCPSKILLPMGIYSESEIRSKVTAPTNPATEKGTDKALDLAKSILESEIPRRTLLIVMSDGQPSTCTVEKPSQSELDIAKD
ncbi:hypothetical protein COOONC_25180, partial [Cooperia oncophora]